MLAVAAAWADASRIAGGALQQSLRACWTDSHAGCGESDEFGTQVDASGKVLQEAEPSYAQCTHTSFFTECVTCVEDKCQVRTAPPCTAVRCCTHSANTLSTSATEHIPFGGLRLTRVVGGGTA